MAVTTKTKHTPWQCQKKTGNRNREATARKRKQASKVGVELTEEGVEAEESNTISLVLILGWEAVHVHVKIVSELGGIKVKVKVR